MDTDRVDQDKVVAERERAPFEVSDEELLSRVVRSIKGANHRGRTKRPLWAAIMDTFIVGSTYAHLICRRFGHDPDER